MEAGTITVYVHVCVYKHSHLCFYDILQYVKQLLFLPFAHQ